MFKKQVVRIEADTTIGLCGSGSRSHFKNTGESKSQTSRENPFLKVVLFFIIICLSECLYAQTETNNVAIDSNIEYSITNDNTVADNNSVIKNYDNVLKYGIISFLAILLIT